MKGNLTAACLLAIWAYPAHAQPLPQTLNPAEVLCPPDRARDPASAPNPCPTTPPEIASIPAHAASAPTVAQLDALDDVLMSVRIVGGSEAPVHSAPWQAQIYSTYAYSEADTVADQQLPEGQRLMLADKEDWEKTHRCGGVYIGDNMVVTAAHCLAGVKKFGEQRRVRLNTQDLRKPGATFAITGWSVHPDFVNVEPYPNDIAILHIEADNATARRLKLSRLAIRMLGTDASDIPISPGDRLRVTGWGRTKPRDSGQTQLARDGTRNEMSPELMQINQRPDPAACDSLPGYRDRIADKTVCAVSDVPGKDSCNGDSGGPMTRAQGRERVLVGIVSWGRGCALPGVPAVYTSIPGYLDWIGQARTALLQR